MKIATATGGYVYHITPNEGRKGCSVEFNGPLNGLLNQVLLQYLLEKGQRSFGKAVDVSKKKFLIV